MQSITLSPAQQAASDLFFNWLDLPNEPWMVIKGGAGNGKSTLIKHLVEQYKKYTEVRKMLSLGSFPMYLTATTNKAAGNLESITHTSVLTIHSFFKLKVKTDPITGKTSLDDSKAAYHYESLIIIDEVSYLDRFFLSVITKQTKNCKILFVGDPYQILAVGANNAPVFGLDVPTAVLDTVQRTTSTSAIKALADMAKNAVMTGKYAPIQVDNNEVFKLPRKEWLDTAVACFIANKKAKILAFTNSKVIEYNNYVSEHMSGSHHVLVGESGIANSFVSSGQHVIKTDQSLIAVSCVRNSFLPGYDYQFAGSFAIWFVPDNPRIIAKEAERYRKAGEYSQASVIERTWLDLRKEYACTVDKSQGSTYDYVFIDLTNLYRCNSADRLARMLYVAVSRASKAVYLTGDFG